MTLKTNFGRANSSLVCFLMLLSAISGLAFGKFQMVKCQPDYLIKSNWLLNPVTIDGQITSSTEWSDAWYNDIVIGKTWGTEPPFYNMRLWVKNDNDFIYLLYRIEYPAIEYDLGDDAAIAYFWPYYDPVSLWEYSDIAWVCQDGWTGDAYGWDDITWKDDLTAAPPGENNVEGYGSYDGTYYWFEIKKELNSGDGYDWNLQPGETYGWKEESEEKGDHLLVSLWDQSERVPIQNYIRLTIATDSPEFVIPEMPFGTILALISTLSALALYARRPIIKR